MERDWARLGRELKAARRALRPRLTQDQFAEKIGVSRATVQNIERGQPFDKITPTLRAFARAVGWTDDSTEKVLAGGQPAPHRPSPPADISPPAASGRARVFRDPRYQAILDSPLPYSERKQMILDLVKADLDRARDQEPESDRYAG